MKHVTATYRIKPDKLAEVQAAIREFVGQIHTHEPRTLRYESFQQEEDPCAFVHIMSFADAAAEKQHESTAYLKKFVTLLYPACVSPPQFAELKPIATAQCERVAE